RGRVVAINTATIPYAEGIGFAIPINAALAAAREIVAHGHVQRPWLGIGGYDVDRRLAAYYGIESRHGVFAAEITPGSPAEGAGLQVGDVELVLPLGPHLDRVRTLRVQGHGEQYAGERGELGQHDAEDAPLEGVTLVRVRMPGQP